MNIETNKDYTVFRNDFNGYSYYKIGVTKKSQTGAWINGYIRCQFKNGVSIENKTKIRIKKSWLSFYPKEKETIPYIFISDFEIVNEIEQSRTVANNAEQVDPFKEFGEEIQLSDNDLPF